MQSDMRALHSRQGEWAVTRLGVIHIETMFKVMSLEEVTQRAREKIDSKAKRLGDQTRRLFDIKQQGNEEELAKESEKETPTRREEQQIVGPGKQGKK